MSVAGVINTATGIETDVIDTTGNVDLVFKQNGVEFMRYNGTGGSLDLSCVLDNTGRSIIGNIIDTTVSNERLKKNIEDVDVEVSDIVKKVNVKIF